VPVAQVEIDIFSGRPNPSIELRGEQALHLKELLAQKRDPVKGYQPGEGLGFRGFVVRLDPPDGKLYRVAGNVTIEGSDAFSDPRGSVQNYIVSVLPPAMKEMLAPLLRTGQHGP
jgi:hypothetical protein